MHARRIINRTLMKPYDRMMMSTRDDMTMSRWDMHDHHVVMTPTCMARHQTLIVTALGLI